MTVSIKIPGSDFSKFFDYAHIPYVEDALALYLFGTDVDSSRINRIEGAANPLATVIGTPTYNDGSALISGTANGFNTLYTGGNGPHTLIGVHGSTGGTSGVFGYTDGATAYKSHFFQSNDDVYYNQNSGLPLSWTAAPGFAAGKLSMTGFTYDSATLTAYRSQGTGVLASTSVASAPGANPVRDLRVGATGLSTGSTTIAAFAAFNRALTGAEMLEIYDYFKFILPPRGIQVN